MEITEGLRFACGDVYLFNASDEGCAAESSLWAIVDDWLDDGGILLEVATFDLVDYKVGMRLPKEFRYCRLATRAELRDFAFGMNV